MRSSDVNAAVVVGGDSCTAFANLQPQLGLARGEFAGGQGGDIALEVGTVMFVVVG